MLKNSMLPNECSEVAAPVSSAAKGSRPDSVTLKSVTLCLFRRNGLVRKI